MSRPIYCIATDIKLHWDKPDPYAAQYIEAMRHLTFVKDKYILDSGDDIIRRFLANATTWRGDIAKAIKSELKAKLVNGA